MFLWRRPPLLLSEGPSYPGLLQTSTGREFLGLALKREEITHDACRSRKVSRDIPSPVLIGTSPLWSV